MAFVLHPLRPQLRVDPARLLGTEQGFVLERRIAVIYLQNGDDNG